METIHGAPSFVLRTPEVELAVTRTADGAFSVHVRRQQ